MSFLYPSRHSASQDVEIEKEENGKKVKKKE
jgi:hypothetical protein